MAPIASITEHIPLATALAAPVAFDALEFAKSFSFFFILSALSDLLILSLPVSEPS